MPKIDPDVIPSLDSLANKISDDGDIETAMNYWNVQKMQPEDRATFSVHQLQSLKTNFVASGIQSTEQIFKSEPNLLLIWKSSQTRG